MSSTIDDRIVSLEFDNKQFEQGVSESLNTLEKLKDSLELDDAGKSLSKISDEAKKIDLSHVSDSVDQLNERFSTLRIVGLMALSNLVDGAMNLAKKFGSILTAPIRQAASGGWNRALNIEEAKFQLEGLGVAWEKIADDINFGVQDTAYGLDAAAKAASQLVASGVKVGDSMKHSLLAISGVAAMTSSSYEEISPIFTTVAGQGKLMTMQLRQLESRGLNAAAVLGKQLGKSEAEIRDMVTKGKISFQEFSDAMYEAFGQHAKDANNTFMGALSNVKAALNKIGAEFATPLMNNMVPVFNSLRLMINAIKKNMGETFKIFSSITQYAGTKASAAIDRITDFLNNRFTGINNLNRALYTTVMSLVRIGRTINSAFKTVFNGSMGDHINNLARGIEKIATLMAPSEKGLHGLEAILVVIFSIIKKIGQAVSFIIKNVGGPIFTIITKTVHLLFNLIGVIYSLVTGLIKVTRESETFQRIMKTIGNVVSDVKNWFGELKDNIFGTSDSFKTSSYTIERALGRIISVIKVMLALPIIGIYVAFNKLRELDFSKLEKALSNMKKLISELIDKVKASKVATTVINGLTVAATGLIGLLVSAGTSVKEFFNKLADGEVTLDSIKDKLLSFPVVITDLLGSISGKLNFQNIPDKIQKAGGVIATVFEKIKNVFAGLKKSLSGLTPSKALLVAFAAGITLLSWRSAQLVETFDRLAISIGSVLKRQMFSRFDRFLSIISALSIAMLSLGAAFKILDTIKPEKLTQIAIILGSFVAGFFALAAVMAGLDVNNEFKGKMRVLAGCLAALGASLLAIAATFKVIQEIKVDKNMVLTLTTMGVVISALVGLSILMSRFGRNNYGSALSFISFAVVIIAIGKTLSKLDGVDLSGIKGAWKELLAIIVGMSLAAKVLASVGLSALVGVIAYLSVSRILMKELENYSEDGNSASKMLEKFKSGVNSVINGFKDLMASVKSWFSDLAWYQKAGIIIGTMVVAIGGIIGGVYLIAKKMALIPKAAKEVKKAKGSIAGLILAIGAVALVTKYIAEWVNENPNNLANFAKVAGVIGGLILLAGVFVKFSEHTDPQTFKYIGKTIKSFGVLFVGLGGLLLTIHLLTPGEINQATELITRVMVLIGIIVTLSEIIGTLGTKQVSSTFGHFAGMVLMIGVLLGAMAALMVVLNTEDDYKRLVAAISAVVVIVGAIALLFKAVSKIHYNTQWKVILTMVGGAIALGSAIVLLANKLPDENYLGKVVTVAGVMLTTIAALVGIMALIAHFSKSSTFSVTAKSAATMNKAFEGLGLLIAGILVVAVSLKILESSTISDIAAKSGIILGVLTLLTGLVVGIQLFQKKFQGAIDATILRQIFALTAVFAAIALVVGLLNNFGGNAGGMLKKVGVVSLVLVELVAIAAGLTLLAKAGLDTKMATVALLGLAACFVAIGATLGVMVKLGATGSKVIGASQVIMLVLLEMGVIAAALGALKSIVKKANAAIPIMVALTACFAVIGLVLAAMVKTGATGSKAIGISQVIVLVLLELAVIAAGVGALAGFEAAAALGAIGIAALIGVMYLLTKFIEVILPIDVTSGVAKIEELKTLLWSLIGILAVLSLLGVGGVLGATSLVILAAGITVLAIALEKMSALDLNDLSDGIKKLSGALAIVVALGLVGTIAGAGLIVLAAGIAAVGVACIAASAGVTMLMAVIGKIGEKISEAVSGVVDGAKKMADGFKEKFEKIVDFATDIIATLKAKITGVDFKATGKSLGDGLVAGFRAGTGWHSPPKFLIDFFKDCGIAVNQNANGITDLFEGTGNTWASALQTALGSKLTGILDGIDLGSLDSSGIMSLMSNIGGLNTLLSISSKKVDEERAKLVELYRTGQITGNDFNRRMQSLTDEEKKLTNQTDDLAESFTGLGDSAVSSGTKVQSFQDSLTSTLESQMNIFQKFEQKAAMSKEELLSNMRSQIEGMSNWAAQMQQLATMGIDKGLYQKLAEMGPQGAEYVGAFASMTAEEMAMANEMWAQSLVLPGQTAAMLNTSYNGIGTNIQQGLRSGMTNGQAQTLALANEQAQAVVDESCDVYETHSPSVVYFKIGYNLMQGLRDGIKAYSGLPRTQIELMASLTLNTAKMAFAPGKYYEIGKNVALGLYNGITQNSGPIMSAIADLGTRADELLRKVTEVESPSKVFAEIGEFWDLGLAKGISDNANTIYHSLEDVATTAIDDMRYTVAQIAASMIDDIEDPVITPVLDLSRIQTGVRTLNSTLSRNRAMVNADLNGTLQNAQQTTPTNFTFTQNNYSPKALSRMDIYRNTKNMFAQAKGALGS